MANYKTRYNQDIFYVMNSTVGDLNKTYDFLLANPSVKLNLVPSGIDVTYTKSITIPPAVKSVKPSAVITSKVYTSRNGQSVFDISLMTTTDYNQLYNLIIASGFDNVNTKPKAGTPFTYNPQKITDNILARYIADNQVIFNTSERKDMIVAPDEKEFMNGLLFYFQDSIQYLYQD